jgi:uncharacterized protein YecE (DUF72 family)
VFRCAEINSSFRHEHRPATYARWAASTPPDFRFSVKLPSEITHVAKLERAVAPLDRFLDTIAPLGDRLGPLLVQLPGSLEFSARTASTFFAALRRRVAGPVVCEPRHPSWFAADAEQVLVRHRVGRVAADPLRAPGADRPGGWLGDEPTRAVAYFRWHGAPRVYWSSYPQETIERWAAEVTTLARRCECWCVFDNTASGAAAGDALRLQEALARIAPHDRPRSA